METYVKWTFISLPSVTSISSIKQLKELISQEIKKTLISSWADMTS